MDIYEAGQVIGLVALAVGFVLLSGKWLHRQMSELAKPLWKRIDELRDENDRLKRELADYKLAAAKEYATVQALENLRNGIRDEFRRMEDQLRNELSGVGAKLDKLAGVMLARNAKSAPLAE